MQKPKQTGKEMGIAFAALLLTSRLFLQTKPATSGWDKVKNIRFPVCFSTAQIPCYIRLIGY